MKKEVPNRFVYHQIVTFPSSANEDAGEGFVIYIFIPPLLTHNIDILTPFETKMI